MLYGTTNQIELNGETYHGFRVEVPSGNATAPDKVAVVRLPTPTETAAFLTFIQYGKKTAEENRECAFKLFKDIRLDKGEEYDEYDAQHIVWNVVYVELVSIKQEANLHTIVLTTPFGEVTHVVRTPSVKERSIFNATYDQTSDQPSLTLYDQIHVKIHGYLPAYNLTDIPTNHKTAVINTLLLAIKSINPLKIDTNPKN